MHTAKGLIKHANYETNTKSHSSIHCMRCVIYIAVVLLFSPWIVLVGAKKSMAVIERSMQVPGHGSKTQLPARTPGQAFAEFARTEAQRQHAVVEQLERDAAERQAATLRLIEKQAAERQVSMMEKIRREVSARQAVMMQKAQLEARKRNATSQLRTREWPTH